MSAAPEILSPSDHPSSASTSTPSTDTDSAPAGPTSDSNHERTNDKNNTEADKPEDKPKENGLSSKTATDLAAAATGTSAGTGTEKTIPFSTSSSSSSRTEADESRTSSAEEQAANRASSLSPDSASASANHDGNDIRVPSPSVPTNSSEASPSPSGAVSGKRRVEIEDVTSEEENVAGSEKSSGRYERDDVLASLSLAQTRKAEGNEAFHQSNFKSAADAYTSALSLIHYLDVNQLIQEGEKELAEKLRSLLISLHSNIAASHIVTHSYDDVITHSTAVLKLDPEHKKALVRRGKAYAAKGELTLALMDLLKANQLSDEKEKRELEPVIKEIQKRAYEKIVEADLKKKERERERKWGEKFSKELKADNEKEQEESKESGGRRAAEEPTRPMVLERPHQPYSLVSETVGKEEKERKEEEAKSHPKPPAQSEPRPQRPESQAVKQQEQKARPHEASAAEKRPGPGTVPIKSAEAAAAPVSVESGSRAADVSASAAADAAANAASEDAGIAQLLAHLFGPNAQFRSISSTQAPNQGEVATQMATAAREAQMRERHAETSRRAALQKRLEVERAKQAELQNRIRQANEMKAKRALAAQKAAAEERQRQRQAIADDESRNRPFIVSFPASEDDEETDGDDNERRRGKLPSRKPRAREAKGAIAHTGVHYSTDEESEPDQRNEDFIDNIFSQILGIPLRPTGVPVNVPKQHISTTRQAQRTPPQLLAPPQQQQQRQQQHVQLKSQKQTQQAPDTIPEQTHGAYPHYPFYPHAFPYPYSYGQTPVPYHSPEPAMQMGQLMYPHSSLNPALHPHHYSHQFHPPQMTQEQQQPIKSTTPASPMHISIESAHPQTTPSHLYHPQLATAYAHHPASFYPPYPNAADYQHSTAYRTPTPVASHPHPTPTYAPLRLLPSHFPYPVPSHSTGEHYPSHPPPAAKSIPVRHGKLNTAQLRLQELPTVYQLRTPLPSQVSASDVNVMVDDDRALHLWDGVSSRSIRLPDDVDASRVEAFHDTDDGVLTVQLPKRRNASSAVSLAGTRRVDGTDYYNADEDEEEEAEDSVSAMAASGNGRRGASYAMYSPLPPPFFYY